MQVNVFKDFVEIVSPRLFPEGDAPEKHLSGKCDEFRPRSPLIAEALYKARLIEQYGTGIPRIRETCEAAGVTFEPKQAANSTVVRFDLPGGREGNQATQADAPLQGISPSNLTENERVAVEIATEHGKVTPKTLALHAQISRRTASAILKNLERKRWFCTG